MSIANAIKEQAILGKVIATGGGADSDQSRFLPGTPMLRQPRDMNGITVSGPATGAVVTRNGVRCIELTTTGAGLISIYFPVASAVFNPHAQMVYEFGNAADFNGGYAALHFYTSGTLTDGMQAIRTIGSTNGWNGVQVLAPMATEWATRNAGTSSSTMTYAMAKFSTAAGVPAGKKFWLYSIVQNERRNLPSIFIGADDGHLTWYNEGLPILEKYGIRGYNAYIHDSASAGAAINSMSVTQWQDAVARGHEAVVHGCKSGINSLRDYFTNLNGYATPYDAMYADITYNRDGMVANGLDPSGQGRKCYILPQGFHQPIGGAGDTTVMTALENAGIQACRLAAKNNGFFISPPFARQSMYLPIIGHSYAGAGEAANIAAIIAQMQDEIAKGRSVFLMFHIVRASPTAAEDISPAHLEAIVAAAATLINNGSAVNGSFHALPARFAIEKRRALT